MGFTEHDAPCFGPKVYAKYIFWTNLVQRVRVAFLFFHPAVQSWLFYCFWESDLN